MQTMEAIVQFNKRLLDKDEAEEWITGALAGGSNGTLLRADLTLEASYLVVRFQPRSGVGGLHVPPVQEITFNANEVRSVLGG